MGAFSGSEAGQAICGEGSLAGLLDEHLVGFLGLLEDLFLLHYGLVAAHSIQSATEHISRICVVINAHDGFALLGDVVAQLD